MEDGTSSRQAGGAVLYFGSCTVRGWYKLSAVNIILVYGSSYKHRGSTKGPVVYSGSCKMFYMGL